jgi:hypothetical protein
MARKLSTYKPGTDTGNDHNLERRLCYNVDKEQPRFERQQKAKRVNVRVAT